MSTDQLATSEYNAYYKRYIDQVQDVPILEGLQNGMEATTSFFMAIPGEKQEYRYEDSKWTPKEILLHIIDTERVFAYRALQFARSEGAVLIGFDQDEFAGNADANGRSMEQLLDEYTAVRLANLHFAKSCSKEVWVRMGEASGSPLSVRAAFYIILGHEIHHCKVIQERYL
ncbi:MAG: DinB family protein [Bacteroidota bacterium]